MFNKSIKKERESSIELLKILAVFFIVVYHVTSTLTKKELFLNLGLNSGFIELTAANGIKNFILVLIKCMGGGIGNIIFVICSSYFLIGNKKDNKKKIVNLWCNTFIISILFLIIFLIAHVDLPKVTILKQFLPILLENNWFVTVYIIFITVVPYLNILIDNLNKKQLFRISLVLFIVYYCICFIKSSFEATNLVYFIVIYFITAYCKKYMVNFWNKKNNCIKILLFCLCSNVLLQLATILLGLRYNIIGNKMLHWTGICNPFTLLIGFSMFYLFKRLKFKSKFINLISSLSLYIYLFHENSLFRDYSRVYIWHYLYEKIGYNYIFIKIIMFSIILFIVSTIVSYIYSITIAKLVNRMIEKIYNGKRIHQIYNNLENKLINIE